MLWMIKKQMVLIKKAHLFKFSYRYKEVWKRKDVLWFIVIIEIT